MSRHMKKIATSLTFLVICLISYAQSDTTLVRKWYYCDSVAKPNELEMMLFYSTSDDTKCEPVGHVFFWEFKQDGTYVWSDTLHNAHNDIVDGIIVTSTSQTWRIDKDVLYMGNNIFVIDVLSTNRLLIHRYKD